MIWTKSFLIIRKTKRDRVAEKSDVFLKDSSCYFNVFRSEQDPYSHNVFVITAGNEIRAVGNTSVTCGTWENTVKKKSFLHWQSHITRYNTVSLFGKISWKVKKTDSFASKVIPRYTVCVAFVLLCALGCSAFSNLAFSVLRFNSFVDDKTCCYIIRCDFVKTANGVFNGFRASRVPYKFLENRNSQQYFYWS